MKCLNIVILVLTCASCISASQQCIEVEPISLSELKELRKNRMRVPKVCNQAQKNTDVEDEFISLYNCIRCGNVDFQKYEKVKNEALGLGKILKDMNIKELKRGDKVLNVQHVIGDLENDTFS